MVVSPKINEYTVYMLTVTDTTMQYFTEGVEKMNVELANMKDQWVQALLRFKCLMSAVPFNSITQTKKADINMIELAIMKGIKDNALVSSNNVYMHDIQKELFVTKASVSQTIGVLEKKGYIDRDVDRQNRRKTIVTLTPEGREIMELGNEVFNNMIDEILSDCSKSDVELFVKNINILADNIEKVINKP